MELIDDVAKTEKQKKALEKKWILEKYQKELFLNKNFSFTVLQQIAKEEINEKINAPLRLPCLFTDTIERLKSYKKLKYQLDYVINEKVKIDFLSDKQKKRLKEYDDCIEHFFIFKKFHSKVFLHIYRNLSVNYPILEETIKRVGKKSKFNQFLEMIKDIDKAVELTEQDKKEAKKEIDAVINRHT